MDLFKSTQLPCLRSSSDHHVGCHIGCCIQQKPGTKAYCIPTGQVIFTWVVVSGAWPDRGRPGPKPGLKAEVSLATAQALAGLAKG